MGGHIKGFVDIVLNVVNTVGEFRMNKARLDARKRDMDKKMEDPQYRLSSYDAQRLKRKENDERPRVDG